MKKLTVAVICLSLAVPAPAQTFIVDDDGPADFSNIQAAIDSAENADTIIVNPGTYTGPGNRDINFLGKAVTLRSTDPNNPNVVNRTVIDCQYSSRAFNFHSAEGPDSVLAGFTITRGKPHGADPKGGAIYCSGASPLIRNCIVAGNTVVAAADYQAKAGAIYLEADSSPVIADCTFTDNAAFGGDGHSNTYGHAARGREAFAGAIYCGPGSSPAIIRCKLIDNLTVAGNAGYSKIMRPAGGDAYGGAIYVAINAQLTITNSTIRNNKVCCGKGQGGDLGHDGDAYGGAISCVSGGSLNIHNCLLTNNEALGGTRGCRQAVSGRICSGGKAYGGAIHFEFGAVARLANCTIARNCVSVDTSATYGSAIACPDMADVTIQNAILWANSGALQLHGHPTVTYSNIEGGWPGLGNINADPCFVAPGRWDDNNTPDDPADDFWVGGDYHLRPDSACLNTGDPNFPGDPNQTDIDGEPRVIAGRIDIGADEVGPKQADLNRDGIINFRDLSALLRSFNSAPDDPDWNILCDLHPDGQIHLCDLSILTKNWLWQAPWHK